MSISRKNWEHTYNEKFEVYEDMHASQEGLCLLCKEEPIQATDHCHDCTKIRGLLCRKCNTGLGHFNDSIEDLQKAIAYLETHEPCLLKHVNKGIKEIRKMFWNGEIQVESVTNDMPQGTI